MTELNFYSKLQASSKTLVLDNIKKIDLKRGQVIFKQGEVCESVFFVETGRIKVVRQDEVNKNSILLYYITEREQCNTNLTNSQLFPAIGTGIAMMPSSVYAIPTKIILEIFNTDEGYRKYIIEEYAKKAEYMAQLVGDVRFKTLDARLFEWIKAEESTLINVSHDELSDIIGTSREVVSRLLKLLEKSGQIKLARRKIEIVKLS